MFFLRFRIKYSAEVKKNMNYKDYQKSRDIAWRVLICENVRELPVMVGSLCRNMGIKVRYYATHGQDDGYSMIADGQPWIFVSSSCGTDRQRFTVAHELGNILLGHVGEYELVNREPSANDNPIEHAANVFASRLLSPACVLWALDAWTPDKISALCKISYQSAQFRAQRMAELRGRGKFLSSPLERAVYTQFEDFIRLKKSEKL